MERGKGGVRQPYAHTKHFHGQKEGLYVAASKPGAIGKWGGLLPSSTKRHKSDVHTRTTTYASPAFSKAENANTNRHRARAAAALEQTVTVGINIRRRNLQYHVLGILATRRAPPIYATLAHLQRAYGEARWQSYRIAGVNFKSIPFRI